jgi:hypothetical protein
MERYVHTQIVDKGRRLQRGRKIEEERKIYSN